MEESKPARRRRRSLGAWSLPLAVVLLGGCGDAGSAPTASLQGDVTVGGQPLPAEAQGSITFGPTAPGQAPAVTVPIVDGRYDSEQTPVGQVKAYFNIQAPTGRSYTSERSGGQVAEMKDLVAAQYASGIEIEVQDDDDDLNFDLTPNDK